MYLKKILTISLLFCSTLAYAGSKVQPTPPPVEQTTPPEKQQKEAAPQTPYKEEPLPPAPAPLPSSQEMTTSYESAFVRMLVTLLGLVFLIFATFWVLKRMGRGKFSMGSGRSVNILERRALSPKTMLYIVEIGNKKVLISESQVEVRSLASYEEIPDSTTE
jgi:flagellar biogenesis protein FliO